MKLKVILFGSTGMIGQGVLSECLNDDHVGAVLVINRQASGVTHPKLREIIHTNIFELAAVTKELSGYNACLFCLGISSAGMKEEEYYTTTYELTIHVATVLLNLNKDMTFCYISGAGTDSTEKGSIMWARVKGKTENDLLKMPFKGVYMFRPGFIQPMHGEKSKTRLYNLLMPFFKPFYFILKSFDSIVTNTETLGKAMIRVASGGYEKKILESRDINAIGKQQ